MKAYLSSDKFKVLAFGHVVVNVKHGRRYLVVLGVELYEGDEIPIHGADVLIAPDFICPDPMPLFGFESYRSPYFPLIEVYKKGE
jgi:hypothetical protein